MPVGSQTRTMLRTAIVGLGDVAHWHEAAIETTPGAVLTAVAERHSEPSASLPHGTCPGTPTCSGWWRPKRSTGSTSVRRCRPTSTSRWPASTRRSTRSSRNPSSTTSASRGLPLLQTEPASGDSRPQPGYYRPLQTALQRIKRGDLGRLHSVAVHGRRTSTRRFRAAGLGARPPRRRVR